MYSLYQKCYISLQTELLDPAVRGTLNVLRSCSKISSIKRVIDFFYICSSTQWKAFDGWCSCRWDLVFRPSFLRGIKGLFLCWSWSVIYLVNKKSRDNNQIFIPKTLNDFCKRSKIPPHFLYHLLLILLGKRYHDLYSYRKTYIQRMK